MASIPPSTPDRRIVGRLATSAVVAVTVVGTATLLLLREVDGSEVGRTVAGLGPSTVGIVLVVECLGFACLAQVYRTTHRLAGGAVAWREAVTAALGAFTLTQLLPGGGGAGAVFVARRLRQAGSDTGTAAATVVLTGLVMMATLGVVVSLAAGLVALATGRHAAMAVASLATTAVVVIALVVLRWLLSRQARRDRAVAWAARITRRSHGVATRWSTALAAHGDLLAHPRSLLRPAAWSAGKWLLDAVVLAVLAEALGADASVAAVLIALGVANLVAAVPLTPGGVGLVEAGMAGALVGLGVDPLPASLTAISYRVVAQWLPVAVTLPVLASGVLRRSWLEAAT